jgi:arylsulfatase A-like enzyme
LPANFLPQHPFNNGEMVVRDEQLLPWPRQPAAIQQMLADYYRYITYLDVQVGRVLAAVEASPEAANTLIVFAADSGVARGSHGLIGKQNLYEHSVRVPLIIAGPGVPKGQRTDALCFLFDVLPTLGKVCGVSAPQTSEGREFTALFTEPASAHRSQLFFGYRNVQRALSDGRWKLIRYPQVDRTQLFDLQTDPFELTDLSAQPEHAARVAEMLSRLAAEQKAVGDPLPLVVAKPQPAGWTAPKKLPKPGEKGF